MTIVTEDSFRLRNGVNVPFESFRKEIELSLRREMHEQRVDGEKTRLLRAAVGYEDFKALSTTVHLVPVRRRNKVHSS